MRVSAQLFVLGGFDGFKWLNDLHVLDVAKLEESEITTQVCAIIVLLNGFARVCFMDFVLVLGVCSRCPRCCLICAAC